MTKFASDSANQASREAYACAGCGVREGQHKNLPLSSVLVMTTEGLKFTGEHLCPLCVDKHLFGQVMEAHSPGEPVRVMPGTLWPFSPPQDKAKRIASLLRHDQIMQEEEKRRDVAREMTKPATQTPLPTMPTPQDLNVWGLPRGQKGKKEIEEINTNYAQEVWIGEKKEIKEFLKAFEHAYGYNMDFANLLNEMARIHVKKNRDYAEDTNRYSNFEYAAQVAEPFTGVDKVFATMIGIKLARMAELKKGKTPNFESLTDSHLDESVYSTLWASYNALKERENEKRKGDPSAER